jgi:hypothetical protein
MEPDLEIEMRPNAEDDNADFPWSVMDYYLCFFSMTSECRASVNKSIQFITD